MDAISAPLAAEMRRLHRVPEPDVLAALLPAATLDRPVRERVVHRALGLLADLRAAQASGWVNRFLQEYRLNSSEGVALLSLAEAFLRVPDPATADLLIADKLGDADWRAHAGKSASGLVNSATWGLVIGRALVSESGEAGVLRRLMARAGEPFVRQAVGAAMRMMGEIFVMGRTIDEALGRMGRRDHRGFTASFDMLGEAARTHGDADRYQASYLDAIRSIGRAGDSGHSISVKLSALHPRYEVGRWGECVPALTARLEELAVAAAGAGIGLTVDAEESERLEMSFAIIGAVARLPALKGWDGYGMAAQAYGKRARAVIAWADALGRDTGRRIALRLVKGAYWDSEIKRTQEGGLADYPLFTRKAATDVSYLACARDMLAARNIYPAFASHNALTVATLLEWAGDGRDFEFQRLHGMGDGLYERLVREEGYHCRIYAPVGGHRDLLAYLVRRLLENGANSSFVHQLADETLTDAELLADPAEKIRAVGGARHPSIPLPIDLFGDVRRNSAGIDLQDRETLAGVVAAIAASVPPPSGKRRALPGVTAAQAVTRAAAAFPAWSATSVEARARALEKLANLLEAQRIDLMRLCVTEAGKTYADAIGEVREAADFCRYYANQARGLMRPVELPGPTGERNILRLEGRGVWACIAPWNFPLAIFLGQVAAALATGNTVVAKPAPQTPLIAAWAVGLAHEAGVPEEALVLLPGGPEEGEALVADVRVAGVAFTGSTATARRIARTLLADAEDGGRERPLVPLIAETGGLNAMIVDSTALPEQVVADILTSAFRSAGQRCSALRLLLLQEDIADRTLEMLGGAMDTLIVGDPADPATDVGPVIDRPAYDRLMAYRQTMRDRWVKTVPAPAEGLFVPPTVIRLDRIADLTREWFGPILHVATWQAGTLAETVQRINASGFGLTMGLHSRIARAAEQVEAGARVGNLYVNRSMIGAVVGSQPFGGEGLSGTGPKAGGPHYLPRFCVERTVSTDTTSAGGNATLLSLDDVAEGV
jgi:RHH-type proline utilization regulon transcriptional repressor/proline dehydrogenase/delta 1-pyrroline-5-carboxylate dehydrogenase